MPIRSRRPSPLEGLKASGRSIGRHQMNPSSGSAKQPINSVLPQTALFPLICLSDGHPAEFQAPATLSPSTANSLPRFPLVLKKGLPRKSCRRVGPIKASTDHHEITALDGWRWNRKKFKKILTDVLVLLGLSLENSGISESRECI
jgi:hypothetical protein